MLSDHQYQHQYRGAYDVDDSAALVDIRGGNFLKIFPPQAISRKKYLGYAMAKKGAVVHVKLTGK